MHNFVKVRHSVRPGFAESARRYFGLPLSANDALRLLDRGITGAHLEGLQSMQFRFTPDELVELADHGVSLRHVAQLSDSGYRDLACKDIISLVSRGAC
jgi:hypothetical protein